MDIERLRPVAEQTDCRELKKFFLRLYEVAMGDLSLDRQYFAVRALQESKMNNNRIISLTLMSLALACLTGLSAQAWQKKASEDVLKIGTELVQVDVLVLDKDNRPVSGLKREDFQLYDNDKLQEITHFSYEVSKQRGGETSALPKTIAPGELNRVIAFVIDTLHMNPDSVYRTRVMLQDFVDKQMSAGDLVLIQPTAGGSGLYQQFTTDTRVLAGAIRQLRPAFILDSNTPARRSGSSQQVLSLLPALAEARAGVTQAPGQGGTGTDPNIAAMLEEADSRATITALNNLVNALSRLPGRKIGVFVSEGFRAFQASMQSDLSETAARAARANVVFYSIDPNGLDPVSYVAGDGQLDITDGPAAVDFDPNSPTGLVLPSGLPHENPATTTRRRDYFESQDALTAIALDSGGKFFRNTNDIKAGLDSLLQQNEAYYLLGFQPEADKWDGKFHKIKVAVSGRPDLTVTTRRGYTAKDVKSDARTTLKPQVAEALEAINSPLARRDLYAQLTALYRDNTRREPVMTSLIQIDAAKLNFQQAGGKHKTKLEVLGFVLDVTGRAIDTFSKTADLNLDPEGHKELLRDGLLISRTISVRPGVYQVKTLVREHGTGLIGTASSYVEVPDLKTDHLAVSSIFTDLQLFNQDKAGEMTGIGNAFSLRRFTRAQNMAYAVIVYNAKAESNKTQLMMLTRILKNGVPVYKSQLKPVEAIDGSAPPARIHTGGILQLASLTAGDYLLEVTIVDRLRKKDNVVRQEIDFTVQ